MLCEHCFVSILAECFDHEYHVWSTPKYLHRSDPHWAQLMVSCSYGTYHQIVTDDETSTHYSCPGVVLRIVIRFDNPVAPWAIPNNFLPASKHEHISWDINVHRALRGDSDWIDLSSLSSASSTCLDLLSATYQIRTSLRLWGLPGLTPTSGQWKIEQQLQKQSMSLLSLPLSVILLENVHEWLSEVRIFAQWLGLVVIMRTMPPWLNINGKTSVRSLSSFDCT